MSSVWTVAPLVVSAWFLCAVVKEVRATHKEGEANSRANQSAFIPTIRDMIFQNAPYRTYVAMRLCVTFIVDLPVTVIPYYAKFVLQVENSPSVIVSMGLAKNLGALIFFPIVVSLLKHIQPLNLFIMVATINMTVIGIVALLPQHDIVFKYNLHLVMAFFGPLCDLCSGFPMEMVLNGVIEYDQLISGKKRAGMYVTLDSIIKQIVDMLSSLLPTSFLILSGYLNNGGCSCGCTTHCDHPYERWHCGDDIGYACSDSMEQSNPPFFGAPSRIAPCTVQNTPTWLSIHFYEYTIIWLVYGLFIRFCLKYPVTPEIREAIAKGVIKRESGEPVVDPLTKRVIDTSMRLDAKEEGMLDAVKHFTRKELEVLVGEQKLLGNVTASDSLKALQAKMTQKLKVRLTILAVLQSVLIFGWIPEGGLKAATEALIVIVSAALLMTMSLNVMRQRALTRDQEALIYFINYVRFQGSMSEAAGEQKPSVKTPEAPDTGEQKQAVETPAPPKARAPMVNVARWAKNRGGHKRVAAMDDPVPLTIPAVGLLGEGRLSLVRSVSSPAILSATTPRTAIAAAGSQERELRGRSPFFWRPLSAPMHATVRSAAVYGNATIRSAMHGNATIRSAMYGWGWGIGRTSRGAESPTRLRGQTRLL